MAALAAGCLAAPQDRYEARQPRLPLMKRQYSNATSTRTVFDSSALSTVYETVNLTVTVCTDSALPAYILSPFTASPSTLSTPAALSSSSSATSSSSASTSSSSTTSSSSGTTSSSSSSPGMSSSLALSVSMSATTTFTLATVTSSTWGLSTAGEPTIATAAESAYTTVTMSSMLPSSSDIEPAAAAPTCTLLPGAPITNEQQVGNSIWGTLCQPYFPQWLGDSPTVPWGENRTVKNSDATVKKDIPITNVTRPYNFTVSRGQLSPDGVLRDVILINNQFPGPAIEANWGDWIEVTVHNNISSPFEGTSLHWHGQLQRSTPWEDGVPGAGQCPIAPGHSLTYRFQAELHGSSWYHAHYSAQFTAGVAGPMIVHGPSSLPYDIDVGPVMLSDWYHIPYFSIVEDVVGSNFSLIPPTSDNVLINGRGQFGCSSSSYDSTKKDLATNLKSNLTWQCIEDAPLAAFRFQAGKVHRLRLVNHGANGVQRFTIDNHNMTVISTDLVPTEPYTTDVVTLGVGQRTDVLVQACDDPTAAVWMRTAAPGGEPCGGSDNPYTVAAVYYNEANVHLAPTTTSTAVINNDCINDPLNMTVPAYHVAPSNNSFIQDLTLSLELNSTGEFEFRINGQAWKIDYNVPLLPQYAAGNMTFEPQWQVYEFGHNQSITFNITNNMPLVHPFHLHGHNFYILNVGDNSTAGSNNYDSQLSKRQAGPQFQNGATWDGSVVNAANPMRRDSLLIPPYGFAAIQVELDNPGVWPFHCHVAWHLSGGQGLSLAYKYDEILAIPDGFIEETCADWDWYTNNHGPVDQIDSGA
ncbi:hypothetical protein LTR86_007357 [Recurvomyces mirabilis]|nr:hypothetical protein LTR86_007357 [Recurvomyces mirabilis]